MTLNARNPIYSSVNQATIDVEYEHPEFGWIPFTASPDDVEQHGRDIYAAAISGEYGAIAPYDGPSEEELMAETVRSERDRLLQELDAIVSSPLRWSELTSEQQQTLAVYRQALLDVPQQDGFPHEVVWPVKPEVMT